MGRTPRPTEDLTLDDHQALAARLRGVRAEVQAVRDVIKTALNSGSEVYQHATRVLQALTGLETALRQEAVSAFCDDVGRSELQRLYGEESPKESR